MGELDQDSPSAPNSSRWDRFLKTLPKYLVKLFAGSEELAEGSDLCLDGVIVHNNDVALADGTPFLNLLSQRGKLIIYEG